MFGLCEVRFMGSGTCELRRVVGPALGDGNDARTDEDVGILKKEWFTQRAIITDW